MRILEEWRIRDVEQKAERASSRLHELDSLRKAMHYATQYEQDGPGRVFEVTRTLVRPNADG